jgi:hypothetical protein
MAENYWFTLSHAVVQADADNIQLVFDYRGTPVDVSTWTNMTYKAEAENAWTTDVIEVADGAIVRSSSGTGVTDTITIPFSVTDTAKDKGRYNHSFGLTVNSQNRTIFRGTIKIVDEIAEIP